MPYKLPFKPLNIQTPKKSEPDSDYTSSKQWQKTVRNCIDSPTYLGRVIYPQAFTHPPAEVHTIFEESSLDFETEHTIIEVYRGSAKSTFFAIIGPQYHTYCEPFKRANFYPKSLKELQAFLREQRDVLVVIQSKSGDLARSRLRDIGNPYRSIEDIAPNKRLGATVFQVHFGTPTITKKTRERVHTNRGIFISLGGEQQAHGLAEDFVRPTYFAIDDPETESNTKTESTTNETFNTLMNGVIAGKAPGGRGYTLFTPIRSHSFGRRVKKLYDAGMPSWKYIYCPLIKEKNGAEYSTWEERIPLKKVVAEKHAMERDGTVHLWYQKYQCVLTSRKTQLFKPEDIMLYDGEYFKGENNLWYLKITHKGPYTEYDKGSPFELEEPETVSITFHTGHDPSHGVGHNNACKFTHGYDGINRYAYQILLRNDVDIYGQCLWLIQGSEEDGIDGYDILQEESITVEGNFFEKAMERVLDDVCFDKDIYLPISVNNPRISKDEKYKSSIVGDFKRHRMWFLRKHKSIINIFTSYSTIQQNQEDDPIDGLYLSRHESYAPLHTISELRPRHEKKPHRSKASTRRSADSWKTTSPIR